MVWSELGAAMPGSGGSYRYLREAYGRERWGRLMAFLFIWQFVLSGPLEIASGYIGFARYAGYIWPGLTRTGDDRVVAAAVGAAQHRPALPAHRARSGRSRSRSGSARWSRLLAVIVTGRLHFDPRVAFDFPPGAFDFSLGFLLGLGAASRVGIYDYLGYYDICYIGDEVQEPGRVIPRSILISIVAVAAIYIGDQPVDHRRRAVARVRAGRRRIPSPSFIVSIFMERLYGRAWRRSSRC